MQAAGTGGVRWEVYGGIVATGLAFALLDAIHTYAGVRAEGRQTTWLLTLGRTLLFWAIYAAFIPPVLWLAGRWPLHGGSARNLGVHVVAGLAFAYLHTLAATLTLSPFQSAPDLSFAPRFGRQLRLNFALDYLTYAVLVGATYLQNVQAESRRREAAAADLRLRLSTARLHALQAQLNPHFLFNALNAISVLALTGRSKSVVETLACLGDLLRIAIDDSRPPVIRLAEELEFVDRYLGIEQLRFGSRLVTRRSIADDTLDAMVPSLVLQPLVENALRHGLPSTRGSGVLCIEAWRGQGMLLLRVTDNGSGFPTTSRSPEGIGLGNLRARLEQLYGPAHRLVLGANPDGGGASVTIELPYAVAACASPVPQAGGVRVRDAAGTARASAPHLATKRT